MGARVANNAHGAVETVRPTRIFPGGAFARQNVRFPALAGRGYVAVAAVHVLANLGNIYKTGGEGGVAENGKRKTKGGRKGKESPRGGWRVGYRGRRRGDHRRKGRVGGRGGKKPTHGTYISLVVPRRSSMV